MAERSKHKRTEHFFKVMVIGPTAVGRSSVLLQYLKKSFSLQGQITVGASFDKKTIEWDQKTTVRLELWNINGLEQSMRSSGLCYRKARGALVVFDITDRSTLESAARWKKDLDSKVSQDSGGPIPAVLLANKCDLMCQEDRDKMAPSLDEFCKENNFCGWFETSAKENINIEEAIAFLIRQMMLSSSEPLSEQRREDIVRLGQGSGQSQSSCF